MFKGIIKWIKKEAMKPGTPSMIGMGHRPPPPPPQNPRIAKEIAARKDNPAVKDAWEKYQITLKLVIGDEEELDVTSARYTTSPGPG